MTSRRLGFAAAGAPNHLATLEARLRAAGALILDLTVGNPTEVGFPTPPEALAALADPRAARYQPAPLGLPTARAAVAADHLRRGVSVDPAAIAITASSSESYAFLFKLLCDPGDEVLVPAPSYPLFEYLAALEGVRVRPYRLRYDGRWHIDWSTLTPAGARALVVVSPNNPTGSFLLAEDHERLQDVASGSGAALIVDEVFADHPSPAGVPPDAVASVLGRPTRALTFALGGLSKSCALPQLKLGWIAAAGPGAPQALAGLDLIADTYLSVGTPVQLALPSLLAVGAGLRAAIAARVARNRSALERALGPTSPATLLPAEGGWTAILRVPALLSDEAWAARLLAEDGVLVQPGYFFDLGADLGTCLVLSLLPEPGTFDEGIRRLLARTA